MEFYSNTAAISPNGNFLASGYDGLPWLWNVSELNEN